MSATEAVIIHPGEDEEIVRVDQGAIGAIVKSEVEAQLDAAHKYRRSVKAFLNEAISMATMTQEVAESCIYTLPRGDKPISGPSVRLAEICASAYGNLHVGARVVGTEDKEITAQGVAWDLEKNLRATIEVRRRITGKNGRRFNDDMITVTGNAAASIGLRNAIFRVIPRAYVDVVYQAARKVAVGDASTLSARRATVVDRLHKMGVMPDRLLARIERASVEDITLDDLEKLIGLGTAIKTGEIKLDDAFPPHIEPTKGVVDLDQLKPGKEENRGHGRENLQESAASNSAQEGQDKPVVTTSAPSQAAEQQPEWCSKSDFDQLEILATEHGLTQRSWRRHVEETMGFKAWEHLSKDRLEEVRKWIQSQPRRAR